ncbi:MAG: glycogen synthase GlgA [Clostridia bacterium]|nr:glycogen synthase GlgA [Clostridia bacterium]
MKILYAAGEAAPFIKVGGLGDVAGALPQALRAMGHDIRVVIPMYSAIGAMREKCRYITHFYINNSWRKQYCGIFEYKAQDLTYYLIDNEFYFNRPNVYGEFDDGERVAFFSRAVLEILPVIDFFPDILHCNDWHTAIIPVLLDCQYRSRPGYGMIKTLFTIHNIEFQGKFDAYILGNVFGLPEDKLPLLYYGDCINLVKGAIECSDRVNTVSPTYAGEILNERYAFGLEHILRARQFKLSGIVNGIDTESYNPQTDSALKVNYSVATRNLKYHNKFALQEELRLQKRNDVPLIGMVTRLTHQKGMDIVCRRLEWLMTLDIQFVVLGSGDYGYERWLSDTAAAHQDKMRAVIGFDSVLARKIYAGADFFLMPSEYEPCGLAQLISMRYGTVPIVRKTGGLADTVFPFNPQTGEGNGINFEQFDDNDMANAIWRATELYRDKKQFSAVKKNAMSGDYGWNKSAGLYEQLYQSII